MRQKVIDISARIPAPPQAVWSLLDDSASWPSWTPIDAYEMVLPPAEDGTGEVRIFRNGRHTVREQIVERRELRRLSYTLLAGLPLRDYRADIDISPATGAATELRWHTTFLPKVPGTGWIYLRALRKATQAFVDGLGQQAPKTATAVHRTDEE